MRKYASTLAPLLLLAASILVSGTSSDARAMDATLFYAPPDPQPIGPPAIEGKHKADKRSEVPNARFSASVHTRPPSGRTCFTHEEARDRIDALGLAEPYRALHLGQQQGEALRAKLCRWKKDEFVYEIAVLRSDGRIVHVYMNAQSGKNVAP